MWVVPNTSLVGALGQDGRVVLLAQHKLQVDMEAVAMDMIAMEVQLLEVDYPTLGVAVEAGWEQVEQTDLALAAPA